MELVIAEGPLLEDIIDATFPVWNEGLDRAGYANWNAAQLQTPWGRARLQRLALIDSAGHWLASAKRYRCDVRVAGEDAVMCGVGALFTPEHRRGRGHARELLERMFEREQRDGATLAGLFSEIGPEFYARLGFQRMPMDEVTVRVKMKDGTPAMLVRAGDERDMGDIAAMHAVRTEGSGFALRRDRAQVQYAITKKRMLAGLGPPDLRQVEFFVAEEGASAVAYVVLLENRSGWTLEEAGDRDPAGARLGAMLQVLLAREPGGKPPLIRAWWPASLPVPPQLDLIDRADPRDVFMLRSLHGSAIPAASRDVFYWHADHF